MKNSFIPERLYRKIVNCMPIAGVDVIVEYHGGLLMVKRKEEPSKGKWWFPGGRILKYEHPEKTALRKIMEETGLKGKVIRLLGVYTTNLQRWPGIYHYSVHLVYHVKANGKVKLNKTSSEWQIFKKIQKNWHKEFRRLVKESGVIVR